MFTKVIRYFLIAAGICFPEPLLTLSGQDRQTDPETLMQQNIIQFEAGRTREALAGFRALEESSPDMALCDYYVGRCLVELAEQLDEAIERLYGAATRPGNPPDAEFYLARAYHLDYNFTESLKYYSKFEASATRQQAREFRIDHLKATCRSALEITSSYNPYEVMNVTFIDLFDSVQFTQIKMKGGHLQYKPDIYFSDGEDRVGLTGIMFRSPNAVRGEYAFFAGYARNKKAGAQLFRIRKGPGNSWGEPEEIKALNTDGDDVMPYFDPIENDLYYATNGRLGIGGYDLYRSHYDSERDEWSEPMNMGFPINSAMDDILLLPGSDLGMMMFFSNRQGGDSMVTVYRVHLIEPKKSTDVNDQKMLREIASLGGVAEEILAELEELRNAPYREPPARPHPAEREVIRTAEPVITPVKILDAPPVEDPTVAILDEAFRHQAMADSLKELAITATIRSRESEDPNDRWVWQKQILLWEKKSRDQEALADELFARLSSLEDERRLMGGRIPEAIRVDTVIDGITVYNFTGSSSPEGEPGKAPKRVEAGEVKDQFINRFDIMDHSPYTSSNPVPMDVQIPPGTFYRIQLGVFSAEVDPAVFRGISPITGERMEGRGMVKYYAGKFSRYRDASSALARIQSKGFEDAFIVAWYNGNPVTTQKAKQLE
jgi:hypothetical protein